MQCPATTPGAPRAWRSVERTAVLTVVRSCAQARYGATSDNAICQPSRQASNSKAPLASACGVAHQWRRRGVCTHAACGSRRSGADRDVFVSPPMLRWPTRRTDNALHLLHARECCAAPPCAGVHATRRFYEARARLHVASEVAHVSSASCGCAASCAAHGAQPHGAGAAAPRLLGGPLH